jgi:hypothetical protein
LGSVARRFTGKCATSGLRRRRADAKLIPLHLSAGGIVIQAAAY